ncbi:MAG: Gldg family protein [Enterobacterales bacterium]|nr:Gldg family protein [Enterobacterales bacterium]
MLLNTSLSSVNLIKQLLFCVFRINLLPLIFFALILTAYWFYSAVSFALLITTAAALVLGSVLFSLISLTMSFVIAKRLIMLVATSFLIILVFMLDAYLVQHPKLIHFSVYQSLFLSFREGFISLFEVLRFILWLVFLWSLLNWLLNRKRGLIKSVRQRWVMSLSFIAPLLIGFMQSQLNRQDLDFSYWDVSQKQTNSLSQKSLNKLSQITDLIKITAVIDKESQRDEMRNAFKLLNQYQKHSELIFTSRQALSQQQKSQNKRHLDQFVSVEIGGMALSLRFPFEQDAKQTLLSMITQIQQRSQKWIIFIEGHGEASPLQPANRDLSGFYHQLRAEHWPVAVQNLANRPIIANNAQLVVIAAGQKAWLAAETTSLLNYLKQGGNLFLLREENDYIPAPIINFIGIKKLPGVLIDWRGYQSGTPHPAVLIVNQFTKHPVNFSIDSLLAFPWSVGLDVTKKNSMPDTDISAKENVNHSASSADPIYEVILNTHQGIWNELNSDQAELSFTPAKGEVTRSFPIAISFENRIKKQRIFVVGDASFLSNGAVNNYANSQFAMNIIHWLSNSPVQRLQNKSEDSFIQPTPLGNIIFNWLFLMLPFVFMMFIVTKSLSARFLWNKKGTR